MSFRNPSLFNGAAIAALVLASLSGVRTESEGKRSFEENVIDWEDTFKDLPCLCDLPNCAPLTECHRLLHESVDKVVRYVDCPGRNEDCCCKNPDSFIKSGTDEIGAFLASRKSKASSAAKLDTTPTLKTNSRQNYSSESISNLYIEDPIASFEPNSTKENSSTSQPGYPNILSDRTEARPSVEAFEATFPPATEPTPKSGSSEHSTTQATGSLRIVGGSYDPLRNDNWTVHITLFDYAENMYFQCTGSLISPRHILTAAHCRYDSQGNHRLLFKLAFGLQDKNRNNPLFELQDDITFIEHPNFVSSKAQMNDIALIRTGIPVSTSGVIKAIRLLPNTYTTSGLTNVWVRVTGWGGTSPGTASDYLLQTDMQITGKVCAQDLSRFNPEAQLCVKGVNRSDICDGDSGSPLTVYLQGKVYLVGLISAGSADCSGVRPAVAVFVGYHRAWIERTIAEVEPDFLNYVQFT